QPLQGLPQGCGVEVFLAREVAVDRPGGVAGLLGDRPDARVAQPVTGEHAECRLEDQCPLGLGHSLGACSACASRHQFHPFLSMATTLQSEQRSAKRTAFVSREGSTMAVADIAPSERVRAYTERFRTFLDTEVAELETELARQGAGTASGPKFDEQ